MKVKEIKTQQDVLLFEFDGSVMEFESQIKN